jgi:shikimate kinase
MPHQNCTAISLIGMPGVGKSTVGVLLAKRLGYHFVDTDLILQQRAGATLQAVLLRDGYQALRDQEAAILLEIPLHDSVIATGGSAVYSSAAMQRLAAAGPVIYLYAAVEVLADRVGGLAQRGVASPPDHSLHDVFAERAPLYARYATHTVDTSGTTVDAVVNDVCQCLP